MSFYHILAKKVVEDVRVEIRKGAEVHIATFVTDKETWKDLKLLIGAGVGGAILQGVTVRLDDRAS